MPRTGRPKCEKIKLPCACCGVTVERYPCVMKQNKTGRVFCSKECRDAVGCKPRRKSEKCCEQCGKVFYPTTGSLNRFCGKQCFDEWQSRNAIERTCESCGVLFRVSQSVARTTAARWCSNECYGKSRFQRTIDRTHNGKPVLTNPSGYLKIWEPSHPKSRSGWVLEHRAVMEAIVGRYLRRDEHVHHRNGKKDDNRPENLEVLGAAEHTRVTVAETLLRRRREIEQLQQRVESLEVELEEYRRRYGPLEE